MLQDQQEPGARKDSRAAEGSKWDRVGVRGRRAHCLPIATFRLQCSQGFL